MLTKFRGYGAALVALAMSAFFGASNALAQGTGFATAVTGTVDEAKADIILIGVAILAVIVLIAAIAWVSRAIKK